jgi:hypothetical protein
VPEFEDPSKDKDPASKTDELKKTAQGRLELERTNKLGKGDYGTEGNVVAVVCDPNSLLSLPGEAVVTDPPFAVIATRDGLQSIRLLYDTRDACSKIRVGDYLEADGVKQHEGLFDAEDIEVTRGGRRIT